MGRSPCCDESGVKKGPWTPEEDEKLISYINTHGHGSWRALPKLAGLNRCGKSCRLRWTNYLRPDIKRGKFTPEEEQSILNLHAILGNKWSAIATHLPGRTDNEIKNFWNTHLKKKLIQMGFDPMTHRPRTDLFSSLPHLIALASLKELVQLEHQPWQDMQALRLQSELTKLHYLENLLHPNAPSSLPTYTNAIPTTTSTPSISDIDTQLNLLTSLSASFNDPIPNAGLQQESNFVNFSHLPELHSSIGDQNSPASPWLPSSSSLPPPSTAAQPFQSDDKTTISNNLGGDGCSSDGGGNSNPSYIWPDFLLDHPLFQDLP